MTFRYTVTIVGGRGPDAWDTEIVIKAKDIYSALNKASERLPYDSEIVKISRED